MMPRIALISTPWPLFNRPSIQLGALKAFVRNRLPRVQVDTHHIYLSVADLLGYDLYGQISEKTWLSEAPYAALLYPEKRETIARFWRSQSSRRSLIQKWDFHEILDRLEDASQGILSSINWQDYALVGLSICFGQLTSALYFIHHMKQTVPDLKVVVGGSACAGDLGRSLLDLFPEIDFVISGEGEMPLLHLIKRLSHSDGKGKTDPTPGLFDRNDTLETDTSEFSQLPALDQLPVPDYKDYFSLLNSLDPEKVFIPKLPMETSRGCWWGKNVGGKAHRGCAFCNLNLQWQGYRAKSHEKVASELNALTDKYQTLSVSFMDNLLPSKDLEGLFEKIGVLKKDLRLFAEIRATTSLNELSAMANAGMREVQVGIEALSTSLLKKIRKGTSAIQNLEIMKNCESPGLPRLNSNIILEFPGSDQMDVEETLANLGFALPFSPLKGIPFWLGYGSPVWQDPKSYGLKRIHNHPRYAKLFPPEVFRGLKLLIQGYHGGLRHQQRLWRPVKKGLEAWKTAYAQLHQQPGSDPILSYQDGGNFLIIRQRRHGADDMTHRLKDTSRKIYLFCEQNRSISRILARFPSFSEEKVRPFLNMMVDKRLMFREGERFLSLAVPSRGWNLR
ncbi:MAG: RiPP maturation radical SAM C-methyltransferase [Desulfobacteraceae bacterium]|jgi:ribosomal peptide maturation radical SAM protein 1